MGPASASPEGENMMNLRITVYPLFVKDMPKLKMLYEKLIK
jgi:hypothetical protein